MLEKLKGKKINESGYASIVETLVASIVLVISVTAAGLIINSGLKISLEAKNTTTAIGHIQDTISQIKATPYSELGLQTTGGNNDNTLNLTTNDTAGCDSLTATFQGVSQILNANGVPYCQVISPPGGEGIPFNIQTHITAHTQSAESALTTETLTNVSNFNAKKATIIASWFEGDLDTNGLPVMKTVQNEIILSPKTDICVPTVAGVGGECVYD